MFHNNAIIIGGITIKIATFNINSIRIRQEDLLAWLTKDAIDIVALQETKVQDKDFPLSFFTNAGYHVVHKGEKGKNGVAIISKTPPTDVSFGLDDVGVEGEARLIRATYGDITLINTYVPQGREVGTDYFAYKLAWLRGMKAYLNKHCHIKQKVVWLGDLNVAPEDIDVYDPKTLEGHVGFHPDEKSAFAYTKEWGLLDLFRKHIPESANYTFWDYRIPNAVKRGIGWRIDHILVTAPLAEKSSNAYIAVKLREKERPSDHAPLVAEFKF